MEKVVNKIAVPPRAKIKIDYPFSNEIIFYIANE